MAIKVGWPDIVKLLQQGEGPTLEFIPRIKSSKDLTKVVVGFANAQGGVIVAGIDDKNGHLNGVDFDKDWAAGVCKAECEPAVAVQVGEFLRNQKRILVLQVKEGVNKPYRTVDGSVLTREGAHTRQASVEEQKKLNPWGVGGINTRQKKALQFVTEQGSVSNKQYRELCDVSHKTAHIELTELVEKGVLKVEGQGRSTAYVLNDKASTAEDTGTASNLDSSDTVQELPRNGQLFSFDDAEDAPVLPKVVKQRPKPVKKVSKVKNNVDVKGLETEKGDDIGDDKGTSSSKVKEFEEDDARNENDDEIQASDGYESDTGTDDAGDVTKASFLDV